jgi:hypothetical protein
MLDDRSFDQMLGALKSIDPRVDGLTGNESSPDSNGNAVRARPLAIVQGKLNPSPDSCFLAVDRQIYGGDVTPSRKEQMQGFVKNYLRRPQSKEHSRNVMYYFSADKVPVLTTLALEFAVCDRCASIYFACRTIDYTSALGHIAHGARFIAEVSACRPGDGTLRPQCLVNDASSGSPRGARFSSFG